MHIIVFVSAHYFSVLKIAINVILLLLMFPSGVLDPDDVKLLRKLMDWHKYAILYEYTESDIKRLMELAEE